MSGPANLPPVPHGVRFKTLGDFARAFGLSERSFRDARAAFRRAPELKPLARAGTIPNVRSIVRLSHLAAEDRARAIDAINAGESPRTLLKRLETAQRPVSATVLLPPPLAERVDAVAARIGIPRADAIRALLEIALEELAAPSGDVLAGELLQ